MATNNATGELGMRSAEDPVGLILRAVAFAAEKHKNQRRKDADATPYINHPIALANVLKQEGEVDDVVVLAAAILHDTIEDTETTAGELRAIFGEEVTSIVLEVTDDKSLPKAERKRLQIEHAAHASPKAKLVKLADKICNLRDIAASPPADWSIGRKREYFDWAIRVVEGCRGINEGLDAAFDMALEKQPEWSSAITDTADMNPLAKAITIASTAHLTHAPDKGGSPYILHPIRMMMRMTTDEERMTAVLHDVVEDHASEGWTFERLAAEGIPESVIAALRCVTKLVDDEDYTEFIHRAASNTIAKAVKLADLEDNMNMLRIAELTDKDIQRLKKYHLHWRWLLEKSN